MKICHCWLCQQKKEQNLDDATREYRSLDVCVVCLATECRSRHVTSTFHVMTLCKCIWYSTKTKWSGLFAAEHWIRPINYVNLNETKDIDQETKLGSQVRIPQWEYGHTRTIDTNWVRFVCVCGLAMPAIFCYLSQVMEQLGWILGFTQDNPQVKQGRFLAGVVPHFDRSFFWPVSFWPANTP